MEDSPELSAEAERLKGRPSRARYDRVHLILERKWRRRALRPERMMREVVDALWGAFAGSPYSWCGFYVLSEDRQSLLLGPHRDKPACSPLPLHGVCGLRADSVAVLEAPELLPTSPTSLAGPCHGNVSARLNPDEPARGPWTR